MCGPADIQPTSRSLRAGCTPCGALVSRVRSLHTICGADTAWCVPRSRAPTPRPSLSASVRAPR
eukprot:2050292-Rhodomonas_salina.3